MALGSGFCADGAVQSPSTLFFCLVLGWLVYHCRGIAATLGGVFSSAFSILIAVGASIGGIGQDALASNKFMEASMVLGHGVSFLFCGAVVVTPASGHCSTRGLLLLGVEGPSSSGSLFVGCGIPLNLH